MQVEGLEIRWLGHDTFLISDGKVLITDPFDIKERTKADIVLISHNHYDHCSPEDVKKVSHEGTVVVAPENCKSCLKGLKTVFMRSGDEKVIDDVRIKAVPAYNVEKSRLRFHPKDYGGLGYIVDFLGKKLYFAGDTDLIPEMSGIDVDIAFLPVSGTYVMTAEDAAEATKIMRVKIAIPMHYGSIVGSRRDAERFKELASCKVIILE